MKRTNPPAARLDIDKRPSPGGGDVVEMKPYSIGTAARLAGIPLETLRMWERRYQLLAPGRTVGGHRLYSQADIDVLRAAKKLVDEGMRIGSVTRMSVTEILDGAGVAAVGAGVLADSPVFIEEIVEAAQALDTRRVSALLDRPRLFVDGLQVVAELYLPLLARIGDMWHQGLIGVGVEHFVEKLVTARLHALVQSTAEPVSGRLALCACPPDDRHEAGLLAAALSLKTHGFAVSLLGADLPADDLAQAAVRLDPAVVVIGVTNTLSPLALRTLPAALERAPLLQIPLMLGGFAAPELAALLTRSYVLCSSATDAGARAQRLL